MNRNSRMIGHILLFGLMLFSSLAKANNELEIYLYKYSDGIGGDLYGIGMNANKDGAASMEVTTPSGTFVGANLGGIFVPELLNSTLVDLSFSSLTGEIAGDWTLIWDKGLATETVATVGFGSVSENEFLAVPSLINPVDGASGVSPTTSFEWEYTIPVIDAQLDRVELFLSGPGGLVLLSDELPLSATSWIPPTPLAPGLWEAILVNGTDIREVANGIGGSISGDPWVIQNLDWLGLDSVDRASFTVVPLPGALWLFISGLIGVFHFIRRRPVR